MNDATMRKKKAAEQRQMLENTSAVAMENEAAVKHVAETLGYDELVQTIENGEYESLQEE